MRRYRGPPTKCPNCNWFDVRYPGTVCDRCGDSPVGKELAQMREQVAKLLAEKQASEEEREVLLASLAALTAEVDSLKDQLSKASTPVVPRQISTEAEQARLINRAKGLEGNNE